MSPNRRIFLSDVGKGMLAAGLGLDLANDLQLCPRLAAEEPRVLPVGELEPLISLLQETPRDKILPLLVKRLQEGLSLKQLTAAGAFANARTFGGENYFGFHVFMAMLPAYQMAGELPANRAPLPLLKVLYRNAHYTGESGGSERFLRPIAPADNAKPEELRKAVLAGDRTKGEQILAALGSGPEEALNAAILAVEETHDVHTAVMPWRAYAMLELVGKDQAVTMLRQSIRQCAKQCETLKGRASEMESARKVVPALLDRFKLDNVPATPRIAEDAWLDQFSKTLLQSSPAQAGEAVANALSEGFPHEHVGEAISLAANQLVLRQVLLWDGKKPLAERTHGDSPGVHASDCTNAWRNMARVSSPRNRSSGLILAAMDVARSSGWKQPGGKSGYLEEPLPHADHLEKLTARDADRLLKDLDSAIRENDQARAAALAHAYGRDRHPTRPIFDLLLQYAISEDGRLHAEKYYRTVTEEFATTRASFRWRHVVALARVTASMYGYSQQDRKEGRAPGFEEACRLLKI